MPHALPPVKCFLLNQTTQLEKNSWDESIPKKLVASMVLSRAASTSKRKKTADMPDSPPKRVTRARAKAAGDVESQLKAANVVTASAKASVKNKRTVPTSKATALIKETAPAKSTKRKTRADDENPNPRVETPVVEDPQKGVAKKRSKQKKLVDETKEDVLKIAVPTPRTRSVISETSIAETKIGIETPNPKGRANKAASTKSAESIGIKYTEDIEPSKNLRARPTAVATKRSIASSTGTKSVTRKKVNFQLQDELDKDKENAPLTAKVPEKGTLKTTGLKAKPIRKPALAKTGNRGKKGAKPTEIEGSRPLSPKKATQVAKSSPACSEDELGSDKTPVRPLSRSPIKPPMSVVREVEKPVSKIDFGNMKAPPALENVIPLNALASPARRPPPSPFKDALKESPKRLKLGESSSNSGFEALHSPTKLSLLQSPARRLAISTASSSGMKAPPSTMKASLLQTPARRPAMTPIRFLATSASPKSDPVTTILDVTVDTKQSQFPRDLQPATPKELGTSLVSLNEPNNAQELKEVEPEVEANSEVSDTQESNSEEPHTSAENVYHTMDFAADAHSVLNISPSPAHVMAPILMDTELHSRDHEQKAGPGGNLFASAAILQVPIFTAKAFLLATTSPMYDEQSESEDELTTGHDLYAPTPFRNREISKYQDSFTPLATKLSGWRASSPGTKIAAEPSQRKRAVFSPAGPTFFDKSEQRVIAVPLDYPNFSFFEDEIAVRDEEGTESLVMKLSVQEGCVEAGASQESQPSEEYGDENALPLDPQLLKSEPTVNRPTLTCTPQKVFSSRSREIHTVSKVSLRPASDDSPIDLLRERGRSLAGPLIDINTSQQDKNACNNIFLPTLHDVSVLEVTPEPSNTPESLVSEVSHTPGDTIFTNFMSPVGNLRKGSPNVLKGAVVYVDVHTTEGADASGIFLDLLTQMGARCVKQWLWNSRSGAAISGENVATPSLDCATPSSKVGITHVVYKDGGRRTLEKVREANGVVLCVGVGWVLE